MAFPVDEQRIDAAERALGRPLPTALRKRLRRDNGGDLDLGEHGPWQLHPVWDDGDRRRAARTAGHVVRETEAAREAVPDLPEGAVVVAADGSGDLLLLLPDEDEPYRLDHETGELESVATDWA